ncbi:MAG TPA: acyl-CoA dehydrogenase family protein [Acidobacteriota bacterium]|nr:acyl-CoA dehydrogenase family protein [Acidobacteriota bacterium]HNB72523.1 acyl-CoA dehydrogenase family protein [Acidobacteriota bacterium]HNC43898.1 acyl-CoA dehydrogenase family protein [Acidobacteriota bacterium]HNG94025.1 acyl-CoA dehydrogenase family protein [Acidobacteriota bacterium]HNJ40155.1 acyl-CoA dehydrogenase family protein [Acidobacteriota bacterium]
MRNVDYFNLDSQFTEEELMVRSMVRGFVQEQVLPVIEEAYEQGVYPTQLIKAMGELGMYGANLPEEYGCAGMNSTAYGLVMQELEAGDSGVRSFASVQGSLVMYPIFAFGTEEQKRKWLPEMAKGNKIGCFGLTEPDFGSNPGGMVTRAERTKYGWKLNGAKMWITNGTVADVAVVWAKTGDDTRSIRGFLVEKGTAGFSAPEIKRKHSLRASITSELIFEDCEIPEENILPKVEGLRGPLSCLNQARYGIAWGAVGSAMATYNAALEYSLSRIQFDRPIAGFQLTQKKLADMITEITKAQMMSLHLGRLKDQGKVTPAQISMAKRNNVAMALETARTARTILGANGISGEYPVMRHMNNLESVLTYEGTHDIHTLIIGNEVTGIQAFK